MVAGLDVFERAVVTLCDPATAMKLSWADLERTVTTKLVLTCDDGGTGRGRLGTVGGGRDETEVRAADCWQEGTGLG